MKIEHKIGVKNIPFSLRNDMDDYQNQFNIIVSAVEETIKTTNQFQAIIKVNISCVTELGERKCFVLDIEIFLDQGFNVRGLLGHYRRVIKNHLNTHPKELFEYFKIELSLLQSKSLAYNALKSRCKKIVF